MRSTTPGKRVGHHDSGIKVTPTTGFTLIAFRDPDNIQMEMYLAQAAATG